MFTDPQNLYRLKETDLPLAGRIMGNIFQKEPQVEYFIPDSTKRKKLLTPFYSFLLRYGILYGRVYAPSARLEGIAIWLPPANSKMTFWKILRAGGIFLLIQGGVPLLFKLLDVLEPVANLHKKIEKIPHWYLFLLGVKNRLQGQGYARTLLRAMLAKIDEEHSACYLETQNQKNVDLYQRYGFELIGKIQITNSKLSFWGMLRKN
jgi:ribosomal protein S18 acetylase RimI-like enzyme